MSVPVVSVPVVSVPVVSVGGGAPPPPAATVGLLGVAEDVELALAWTSSPRPNADRYASNASAARSAPVRREVLVGCQRLVGRDARRSASASADAKVEPAYTLESPNETSTRYSVGSESCVVSR